MLPSRHLVGIVVVGDEVIPNRATDAWARALGLPRLFPSISPSLTSDDVVVPGPVAGNLDGQTAVLVEYAPATHGANWTSDRGVRSFAPFDGDDDEFVALDVPVEIDNPMRATMAQVTHALVTWAAGAPPEVVSTLAPRADFDDDGVVDDADVSPLGQ